MINNKKVAAVIRSFESWIRENTDYWIPMPKSFSQKIEPPYERWYVGITKHDDDTRLKQHLRKNPKYAGIYYKSLNVDTLIQANMVEKHFSQKGTKNKPEQRGATNESIYAYVFKADANIIDEIFLFLSGTTSN